MIKRSQAIKLAEEKLERRLSSTTPDEAGKIIKRSGAYVRKVFSQTCPSFASQLENGRWIIQDCPEYQAWIGLEKIKGERIQHKNIESVNKSGIPTYHDVVTYFSRWQKNIGGINAPLKWPHSYQIEFIEKTINIAIQRHIIINNLSKLGLLDSPSELTESERFFFKKAHKGNSEIGIYAVGD